MKILVTGGTGTVGSQVVRELLTRGHDVKVLTRNPAKAKLPDGATAREGDLLSPATVRRVFDGVEGVFLLNAVSQTESYEALLALAGMRHAHLKRLVYLSVQDADRAPWLPHFGTKVGIEDGIKKSGIPFTILRPNNFYQNDYRMKDALLKFGVYPQPIGQTGVSRVDVRDIAEAAAITLTTTGHEGRTYDVAGPDIHTGESTAKAWSAALGRPVAYGGDDLDAWERQSLQYLPDWMVFEFREMYAFFQKAGLKATPAALAQLTFVLGHAPRPFDAFAKETAAAWAA